MNQRKKKAFTLTELLVVVVIIGVLSAVVLPNFNKVIETRKTTEAEEVMAVVRMEQKYRCSLDKPYIGNMNKLVTAEVLPQPDTKNYTYSLESTGMLASSKGMSYELKIPSYADGRICCEGADCGKLDKDYPTCNNLVQRVDDQQATECTATITTPVEPATCSKEAESSRSCDTGCGTQTRSAECVNGAWVYGDWGPTCESAQTETYDCTTHEPGNVGTKTRTQVCKAGKWTFGGVDWTGECACQVPAQTQRKETCGCSGKGEKILNFDESSCAWETEWSACTEKETGCCTDEQRAACQEVKIETMTVGAGRGTRDISMRYYGSWDENTCTC